MLALAILIYAAAMIAANLIVAGAQASAPQLLPLVVGANAFVLIGLDLALRDWLHVRLRAWQMIALIVTTGALTFVLNPAAGQIAVASAAAFMAAGMIDWLVFSLARGPWLRRSITSNVAGAGVDSVVFPLLAFGSLKPEIVLTMFAAKVAGGAVWAMLIHKFDENKHE